MRFTVLLAAFIYSPWLRDNPVPIWLVVCFSIALVMDLVEWLAKIRRKQ